VFLDFEKWHGCLNDFIVVWLAEHDDLALASLKRQAVALCDRRAGIGADGILVLHVKKRGDLTPHGLTIINSDASIAKNCGNGMRCAALSVLKRHREKGDPNDPLEAVELTVEGRLLAARFLPKRGGEWPHVAVEMGVPVVDAALDWLPAARDAVAKAARELALPALANAEIGVCDVGNPHLVVTTDAASRAIALSAGPYLQTTPLADGINLHVVKAEPVTDKDQARAKAEVGQGLSELFRAYVWERGAGETPACGSGACAIAACAIASGVVERSEWVGVDMPGGRLYVRWETDAEPVVLAGPGAFVYSGQLSI
jgi:diaminopimelate epimerase